MSQGLIRGEPLAALKRRDELIVGTVQIVTRGRDVAGELFSVVRADRRRGAEPSCERRRRGLARQQHDVREAIGITDAGLDAGYSELILVLDGARVVHRAWSLHENEVA